MDLQVLTLNEFLELIVPVCYLFCFLVAFYGHNAHLIGGQTIRIGNERIFTSKILEATNIPGNVRNSYFHYLGMTEADISGFVQVLISRWWN